MTISNQGGGRPAGKVNVAGAVSGDTKGSGGAQHVKEALNTAVEFGVNGLARAHFVSTTSLQFQPSTRYISYTSDSERVEKTLNSSKQDKVVNPLIEKNLSSKPTVRSSVSPVRGDASDGYGTRVSHGASEKQRRDRINAMIDELRCLVPAGGEEQDAAQGEDRSRSKFSVLQDTINLIRTLTVTVEKQRRRIAKLSSSGGGDFGVDFQPEHVPHTRTSSPSTDSMHTKDGMIKFSVDLRNDNCYIKFHTIDRRGLLPDLMSALHELPMDITRANITTKVDDAGRMWVTDIFELKIGGIRGGLPRICSGEVKRRLRNALVASTRAFEGEDGSGSKKRKENDNGGG